MAMLRWTFRPLPVGKAYYPAQFWVDECRHIQWYGIGHRKELHKVAHCVTNTEGDNAKYTQGKHQPAWTCELEGINVRNENTGPNESTQDNELRSISASVLSPATNQTRELLPRFGHCTTPV